MIRAVSACHLAAWLGAMISLACSGDSPGPPNLVLVIGDDHGHPWAPCCHGSRPVKSVAWEGRVQGEEDTALA